MRLLVLLLILALPAVAGPTRSGKLVDFTPGKADFTLVGEDGKPVRVRLVKEARYEVCGRPSASSAFRDGMQVAVRVVGALNEKPIQADLMMDLYSSRNHVQVSARAPYYTQQGDFAFPGGVGGISQGTPGLTGPSVVGQLAHGGNFPGSTVNPTPGQLPADAPGVNQPQNQSPYQNFPTNQAPGAGPVSPSPGGSPFTAEAINQMSPQGGSPTPAMNPAPNTPYPSYNQQPGGYPSQGGYNQQPGGGYNQQQPYYNQQPGGYPQPQQQPGSFGTMNSTTMMGMGDPQGDMVATQAGMMNNDDDDPDKDDTGMITSDMSGPKIVQWNARVLQLDPARRMLVVQPAGMPSAQNVLIPPTVAIPPQALQAGSFVQIVGQSNAAGFVEAHSIQPLEGMSP